MSFNRTVMAESQRLLQRSYRQSQHSQVRQQAYYILLRVQGTSVAQLTRVFPVSSRKTFYNWFDESEPSGFSDLYNRPGCGRNPMFNDEQKAQIKCWAERYPRQLKRVIQKVKEIWGVEVSTDTIKQVLKLLKTSWHLFLRVVSGPRDSQEHYAQKQVALEMLKQLEGAGDLSVYHLDQAGFRLTPSVFYDWQSVGKTIELPSRRPRQLNVLGLMSRQGYLESYVSPQSINSGAVIACVNAFLPEVDIPTVAMMDKAPIHTSYVTRRKAKERRERGVYLFELLSYSPELNLIEIRGAL